MPELDAATDLSTIEHHAAAATALLRLLANERRLMVLCMLIGVGEAGVGTLSAHARLSPAAMWRHLAKLRDDGVVATRRPGTEISSASPTGGWKRSSPPCGTSSA